ncbi:VOC family protein [Paenibacillus sp. JCM 10914]|uniref:VOC family protein n=1 Tax=Paenibacillus sp. JCM 10914 TaxID=1236974 RepID=UPI0003CC4915|nr:VOC family protein [Paenibacillus sp. JCM 10914]GAE07410.1 PhnB protein [Paenibacillus sp. JCM 10914]
MGILKPYLISEDARTQANFYVQSLGGEIVSILTHGDAMGVQGELQDKVMHMCVAVSGRNYIFMEDAIEPVTQGTGFCLSIEFKSLKEAEEAFSKLAEAGKVKLPFELQPFGLYLGELTDKFGVRWMISAEIKE